MDNRTRARRSALRYAVVLGVALALGAAGAAAQEQTVDKRVLLNQGGLTDISLDNLSFDSVVNKLLPPGDKPIALAKLGNLGPLDLGMAKLVINRTAASIRIESAQVQVPMEGGAKPVRLNLGLDWQDEFTDLTPVVELLIDASKVDLIYDDLKDIGGKLIEGFEPSPTNDIAPTIGIADVAFAFRWDPDEGDEYLDVTGAVNFLGVNWGLLLSMDWSPGQDEAQVVYGFRASDTGDLSEHITLGSILKGEWGSFASDLRLPELAFAIVQPEGTVLRKDDLRDIPKRFLTDCLGECAGLGEDFEVTSDLGLAATAALDSLGADIRELYGYAAGATVQVSGKVGVTIKDLTEEEPLDLKSVELSATLPATTTNQELPLWVELGEWKLGFKWLHMPDKPELETVQMTATTSAALHLDTFDEGGTGATVDFDALTATFNQVGERTEVKLTAKSGADWDTPFGVSWMELTGVGFEGQFKRDGTAGTWELSGAVTGDFQLCAARNGAGDCTQPTNGTVKVEAAGGSEGIKARFRIGLADDETTIPVFGLLDVMAAEFGVHVDLGDKIGEDLVLGQLAIAGELDDEERFTFEATATSPPLELLAGPPVAYTAYFRFARQDVGGTPQVSFMAGVRPSTGVTFNQLLGSNAPPGLEEVPLPALGVVVASHDAELESAKLSRDGFSFFRGLHGCPDGVQTIAEAKPGGPTLCTFKGKVTGGVNLLANIQLPEELAELSKQLWIDTTKGLQIRGTVTIPGWAPDDLQEVGLGLELVLPEVNPFDAVEFIERGELALGVRLEGTPDPSVKLFLEGQLETRWRRSDDTVAFDDNQPVQNPDPCVLGTAMKQYLHQPYDPDDNPAYCYDQLLGRVKTELGLSPTKVSLTLLLALEANNEEGVWEQPFGTPFGLRAARVKFGVEASAPLFNPTFTLGFLGAIQVDTAAILGDPQGPPPTELLVAGAMGIEIIKPAPTPAGIAVTPVFKGIRAYFSRLGLYEVIALQKMVYPDVDIASELSIPPMEFRDGEIMIGLEADVDLCIDQRIGLAAEFWLTTEVAGENPPEQDGPCRAFGSDVKPEDCAAKQEEGCFASAIIDLSITGIRIAGAVGAINLGPISFEDSLLDVRLTPLEQLFVVRGGVSIDGVGTGKLAMKLSGLPDFEAELFGYFEAFGVFEAQVTAKAGLGLQLLPPKFDPNMEFNAALRSDFKDAIAEQLEAALDQLHADVAEVAEMWERVNNDPVTVLVDLRDMLVAAGVPVPQELSDLIDFTNDVVKPLLPSNATLPTLRQLVVGGTYEGSFPAFTDGCNFGFFYDGDQDLCVEILDLDGGDPETHEPFNHCPPLSELDGAVCRFSITLPAFDIPGLPGSAAALFDYVADLHEQVVRTIDELAGIVPATLDLEDLFDLLLDGLDGVVPEVSCAEFGFQAGSSPTVQAKLLLELLGQEYGFDWELDFDDIPGSAAAIFGDTLEAYLSGETPAVECSGELDPPAGLSLDDFNQLGLSVDPGVIDENGSVTVTGTFDTAPQTGTQVVIEWGDGTTTGPFTPSGVTFNRTHTYLDDAPSGTPSDVIPITARVNGSMLNVTPTSVQVNNVAPTFTVLQVPNADEGARSTLRVEVFDVGTVDRHTVEIDWGDETSEVLNAPQRSSRNAFRSVLTAFHTYRDDKQSGTFPISFTVRDDDTGEAGGAEQATVRNVAPAITAPTVAALEAMSFLEGAEQQLTIAWTDPGLADAHDVRIDWGDNQSETLDPATGTRQVTVSHTYADDDPTATTQDPYTVTIEVVDDGGDDDERSGDVTVVNVAPSAVTAVLDRTVIDEHEQVTVSGGFADPGEADTHTVTVDWGDPALSDTVLAPAAGERSYEATQQYGDRGVFTITVTVTDDDTGNAARTTRLRVRNVDPTADIDMDGAITPPSGTPTYLLRAGEELTLSSTSEDPGSDDLLATWSWGDGTTTATPYLLGVVADGFPSPDVDPRTGGDGVTDEASHVWASGCLYEVGATWTDDDGGVGSDAVSVVVTGTDNRVRNPGWWVTELEPGQRNKEALTDERLHCYLQVADHLSGVIGQVRPVQTFAQAIAVLNVSKTSQADELLDRQLLTSWMNLAHGSLGWDQLVDTNGDRIADTLFSDVLATAEAVRVDPQSKRADLIAQKSLLERVNGK